MSTGGGPFTGKQLARHLHPFLQLDEPVWGMFWGTSPTVRRTNAAQRECASPLHPFDTKQMILVILTSTGCVDLLNSQEHCMDLQLFHSLSSLQVTRLSRFQKLTSTRHSRFPERSLQDGSFLVPPISLIVVPDDSIVTLDPWQP